MRPHEPKGAQIDCTNLYMIVTVRASASPRHCFTVKIVIKKMKVIIKTIVYILLRNLWFSGVYNILRTYSLLKPRDTFS